MTTVRPFHCGTQHFDWLAANCDRCAKGWQRYRADNGKDESDFCLSRDAICPMEFGISEAAITDGYMPAELAARMGAPSDALVWPCPEWEADAQTVVKAELPEPYYERGGVTIYHGDAAELLPHIAPELTGCLVIDPPWDDEKACDMPMPFGEETSRLVFTDPRRLGEAVQRFGHGIAWAFTWDTRNTWSTGPSRPVQQTKLCLWYGDLESYRRDAALWGEAPEAKNHPSTRQTPLDGRRMTDLWRESLRWLHHPGAGSGSTGTARFGQRRGRAAMRHAKPVGWMRCLIGNTSRGLIVDPFLGSGTTLLAARELGRPAIGIDIDEECCELAVRRLAQGILPFGGASNGT